MLFPQHSEPRPPHQLSPGRSYPEPSRGPWEGRAFCKNIRKSKGENKGLMPWFPIQIASLRLALSLSLKLFVFCFLFLPKSDFQSESVLFSGKSRVAFKNSQARYLKR